MLIPYSNEFGVVYPNKFFRLLGAEPIRIGTQELFEFLEAKNHEIWIYTTSYRSVVHLKKTLLAHGLKPRKFINEHINQKVLKKHNCRTSKTPALFGIDIHIDDSIGVNKEGEQHGFKTLIIQPDDIDWVNRIKDYLAMV